MLASIQLWCISKQQNDIANILKGLKKPEAAYATSKCFAGKRPNNGLKTSSISTSEAS